MCARADSGVDYWEWTSYSLKSSTYYFESPVSSIPLQLQLPSSPMLSEGEPKLKFAEGVEGGGAAVSTSGGGKAGGSPSKRRGSVSSSSLSSTTAPASIPTAAAGAAEPYAVSHLSLSETTTTSTILSSSVAAAAASAFVGAYTGPTLADLATKVSTAPAPFKKAMATRARARKASGKPAYASLLEAVLGEAKAMHTETSTLDKTKAIQIETTSTSRFAAELASAAVSVAEWLSARSLLRRQSEQLQVQQQQREEEDTTGTPPRRIVLPYAAYTAALRTPRTTSPSSSSSSTTHATTAAAAPASLLRLSHRYELKRESALDAEGYDRYTWGEVIDPLTVTASAMHSSAALIPLCEVPEDAAVPVRVINSGSSGSASLGSGGGGGGGSAFDTGTAQARTSTSVTAPPAAVDVGSVNNSKGKRGRAKWSAAAAAASAAGGVLSPPASPMLESSSSALAAAPSNSTLAASQGSSSGTAADKRGAMTQQGQGSTFVTVPPHVIEQCLQGQLEHQLQLQTARIRRSPTCVLPLHRCLDWSELQWRDSGVLIRGQFYPLRSMRVYPNSPAAAAARPPLSSALSSAESDTGELDKGALALPPAPLLTLPGSQLQLESSEAAGKGPSSTSTDAAAITTAAAAAGKASSTALRRSSAQTDAAAMTVPDVSSPAKASSSSSLSAAPTPSRKGSVSSNSGSGTGSKAAAAVASGARLTSEGVDLRPVFTAGRRFVRSRVFTREASKLNLPSEAVAGAASAVAAASGSVGDESCMGGQLGTWVEYRVRYIKVLRPGRVIE